VRAKLEAEGLVAQAAQPTPEQLLAGGAAPTELTEGEERAAGEAQVAAFEERRRRAEDAERARQRRNEERRQRQAGGRDRFGGGGEEMSAMAMAFAMAGADDLIKEPDGRADESASSSDDADTTEADTSLEE